MPSQPLLLLRDGIRAGSEEGTNALKREIRRKTNSAEVSLLVFEKELVFCVGKHGSVGGLGGGLLDAKIAIDLRNFVVEFIFQ